MQSRSELSSFIKPAVLSFLFLLISITSFSQILEPVKWKFSIEHLKDNVYVIHLDAKIDSGWAVYSQYLEREDGPLPTSITFDEGNHYELIGASEEDQSTKKEGFDPVFEMKLGKFFKEMKISQKVRILKDEKNITGYLTYMTCDDSKCLPPTDVEFSLDASKNSINKESTNKNTISTSKEVTKTLKDLYPVTAIASSDGQCDDIASSLTSDQSKSILNIFLLGIVGGLLALVTPCVFPLIPLTVSFFTKGSENKKKGFRKAILYGFFILVVYSLLSVPFHLLDSVNPDILNDISTNVWLNVIFFVVFVVFAISFFGYFEITLPSFLTNKVSSAEDVGGVIGVFFMALTLSLVSFSCTGPILGSLLAGALSSDGGAWQLTAGMSGFGLALALPFTLFAMFPGWMTRLPKSGGWLNTIKVILGFVEIALALKFLSNADLVMHWGFLKYELFLALWVLIGIGISAYLFGLLRFPHDSKQTSLSKYRLISGILSVLITIYLATGFSLNKQSENFNSLKLLSGLAPPAGYSWLYPSDCPNGITCYKDLQSGIEQAKKLNKPILLDFTGYACVNCRKMEEHVWSNQEIASILNNEYVLVSLYVDDKKLLPDEEQVEVERSNGGTRKLRNVGHKWAHFQTLAFNTNAQPFYVAISPDGSKMLNNPVGYTPSIEEYHQFLSCGIEAFKNL